MKARRCGITRAEIIGRVVGAALGVLAYALVAYVIVNDPRVHMFVSGLLG